MILLALIVIETLLLASLIAARFFGGVGFQTDRAIISFINILFLPIFAIDGVIHEKTLDLLAFVGVSLLSFFYSLIEFNARNWDWYREEAPASDTQFKMKFVLTIFFVFLNLTFSYMAYVHFGWSLYRRIGASMELKGLYKNYLRLETFFKVDLWAGLNLALMSSIYLQDTKFIVCGSLSCFGCIFLIIVGWAGVRKESKKMIQLFYALYIFQFAYNFFVLYQVIYYNRAGEFANIGGAGFFTSYLTIFGSLAARILVTVQLYLCYKKFGQGLREVFLKSGQSTENTRADSASSLLGSDKLTYSTL
eukprot:TRINITY_DN7810_c0_g1_i2.p1 TRINITY_DN7810_c0_g1~~TRINITY_DN7810_c0_g1_i2.p1  ORF type:complete len:351 (+),score=79.09 TRINITY_DN7810_c0_g1_i2:137-1054(+)